MDKTIKTLTEVLQESKKEGTTPYDTTAEVVRIEGKTAWVHIPGGIDETPVSMTIDARAGDIVQVRVSGGRAWITGNQSAPPTDDTVARAARSTAETAEIAAATAKKQAAAAAKVAADTDQHFWFQSTGLDTGAHITEVPQDQWNDPLSPNYQSGGNLLARSNGVAIRKGMTELAKFYIQNIGGDDYATLSLDENDNAYLSAFYDAVPDDMHSRLDVYQNNGSAYSLIDQLAGSGTGITAIQEGSSSGNISTDIWIRASDNVGAFNGIEIDGINIDGLWIEVGDLYLGANKYKMSDYVIERGTSGNWKYIKWASGRVECEGWYTFPSLTFSAASNVYRSVSNAFTIPSGIFTTAPGECQAWIQGSNTDLIGASIGGLTTTGGNCQVWKRNSGNLTSTSVHMRLVYRG